MHEYQSSFIRYERTGDRVQPVRITKSWVSDGAEARIFAVTRVTEVPWRRVFKAQPIEECSSYQAPQDTRASLLASGILKEAGHDMVCFKLLP
jgi:hypothetical protein